MMQTRITLQKSVLTLIIALFSFYGLSQDQTPQQSKKEKIEQLKIAYITKELDLTSEEAEKFWPLYNDMTDALKAERKSRRSKTQELKNNFETLSDDEIEQKTIAILDSEIAEAKLRKEHTEKISKVIGYKKMVLLLKAEKQFKRELLNRLNNAPARRGTQGQNRPNRPNRRN